MAISCTTSEYGCRDARRSFSYFTILTYWGLAFYFFFAAVHTATYALRGRPLLDSFPRPLQALHSAYYTTAVVFPFVVTVVYWAVLFAGPWFTDRVEAWENVSQHAANSVFALFEVLIPRTAPMLWVHIVWLLVLLGGYLGLAYVTYAAQGFYVYGFLDYEYVGSRDYVAAYCVGIAVGTIIVFALVWGVVWVRRWLTEDKMGMEGRFAKQPKWSNDQEMSSHGMRDEDVSRLG